MQAGASCDRSLLRSATGDSAKVFVLEYFVTVAQRRASPSQTHQCYHMKTLEIYRLDSLLDMFRGLSIKEQMTSSERLHDVPLFRLLSVRVLGRLVAVTGQYYISCISRSCGGSPAAAERAE